MRFDAGLEGSEDLECVWDDGRRPWGGGGGGGGIKEATQGTTASELLIAQMGVAARVCN